MTLDPLQALQAATRPPTPSQTIPPLLWVCGATGHLGHAMVRQLAGPQRYRMVRVLTRQPQHDALRGVESWPVPAADVGDWTPYDPTGVPDPSGGRLSDPAMAVVLFEPPLPWGAREAALWTPTPAQLVPLARWLRDSGVDTLAVVVPHEQGRLPQALRHGLANLDEQSLLSMGFGRLILVRAARETAPATRGPGWRGWADLLAHRMLSIARYMVPSQQTPVRAVHVAEFVAEALQQLPAGVYVVAPEVLSSSAKDGAPQAVQQMVQARRATAV